MAGTVPTPVFGPKGFIAPQEQVILAAVLNDINAAFGGTLNLALTSPQGQLATSETAVIGNANDTFLYFCNQVDPAYATGRMQDAIARIYFLERLPSEPTVTQAVCTGQTGVSIPAGALAQASDGNIYTCTAPGTIPASGNITLPFTCTVAGAIPCPAGSLNIIYQSILGWDSITNLVAGEIGQDVETRQEFEARRFQSVAHNAIGFNAAILGAVLTVPSVLDAYVIDNPTGAPVTVNGYTLAAHSLYVAAVGGTSAVVANAIWLHKPPGCDMNGNTSVIVYDKNYAQPYPAYTIKYEIPTPLDIYFDVELATNAQVPADAATQIQTAIIAAFSGQTQNVSRARIGALLYASQYYAPVAELGSWAQIKEITIGSANTPTASIVGSIDLSGVLTVTSIVSGVLAANQFLSGSVGGTMTGSGVISGTQIIAQLSGSAGGTGTYSVSLLQTVPSISMKATLPVSNTVQVQIDQWPTITPNDIMVGIT